MIMNNDNNTNNKYYFIILFSIFNFLFLIFFITI